MATDLEKLVVQLSADIKQYQREMNKAVGVSNKQAREIENRFKLMNRNLDNIGRTAARSLVTPLLGIGAALSVREVARYADAWTGAKNSLAVAGVVGKNQTEVLNQLYRAAQDNAAPLTALTTLYGRAAQSADMLGASQKDLIKFSAGVGTALRVAGTNVTTAQGALTQLGQAISSTRVFAEEFNSINEGARPILIAVANGMDGAAGSVSKLRQMVIDGKVSGQQFFQAFLRGLPTIQSMAANATTTIEQGITKVENAFTRYIGQTDESLGASQRLVEGLSELADNFDAIADITVKVAALIGAGLLGRSIAGMVGNLGLAGMAATKFVAAIRAASSVSGVASAIGGLSAAAGPIGAVVGVAAVGALMLYSASTADAREASEAFEKRLNSIRETAPQMATAVEDGARRAKEAMESISRPEVLKLELESDAAEANLDAIRTNLRLAMEQVQHLNGLGIITDEQRETLEDFNRRAMDGTASAKDLDAALTSLGEINGLGQGLISSITQLWNMLNLTSAAARQVQSDIQAALGAYAPDMGRFGNPYARQEAEVAASRAGRAYLDEQRRLQGLTREQLALETEIARLRKSVPDGATVSDEDLTEAARGNLAAAARRAEEGRKGGGGGGGREAKAVERFDDRILKETEGLKAETDALNQLKLGQDRYGTAVARARKEAEMLQDLQNKGLTITPALREQVRGLADDWQREAEANAMATERHEEFQSNLQDAKGTMSQAFSGLIKGAHGFSDALSMVIDKLADIALNAAFNAMWNGVIGNAVSGLVGGLGGFSEGGYTGAGAKDEPAGVVHRGEVVWSQRDVARAGGVAVVEAMRRGAKGYASGGVVIPEMPRVPAPKAIAAMAAKAQAPRVVYVPQPYVAQVSADDDGRIIGTMRRVALATSAATAAGQQRQLGSSINNYSARGTT
ncbi:tape measure protein [Cereibacter azotoformans]|uniref:tape measure protein n=1 Tax=Cereibacter azotoformans TaxID=43057 RepID=UPI000E35967F|nr:tape measure protein [Cereibacter azotoformans]AXQ93207.1 phage tail tape measure protein [Cereibacter sphaeroides]UIJ31519.1 tape measure protein [Cereibacter azotoformans]